MSSPALTLGRSGYARIVMMKLLNQGRAADRRFPAAELGVNQCATSFTIQMSTCSWPRYRSSSREDRRLVCQGSGGRLSSTGSEPNDCDPVAQVDRAGVS